MLDTTRVDITKAQVLDELQRHVGRASGIHVRDLVARITNSVLTSEAAERKVRDFIQELRLEHHAICGYPGTGYYIAADRDELRATCAFLVSRMDSTAQQVAAMLGNDQAPDLYTTFGLQRPKASTPSN